jgi:phage terminase large subunit-like protein
MSARSKVSRYASDFAAFCEDAMIPQSIGGPVRFGSVMAEFQRRLIADLAPSLLAIATGKMPPTTKFWAEMSKGSGKDLVAGLAILWLLMFARRPVRIQLGASDQDQAGETHRSIVGILLCGGNEWMAKLIETPNNAIICKTTNSDAEVLAADVQGSHGAVGVDLLVLNELHAVSKWQFIENLADNASKNPAAVTILLTNAGFKTHPAWRWRENARTSPLYSFHSVCEPPPWTNPAEIEDARARSTATRFMRLWYTTWSSGAGDALDDEQIAAAIDSGSQPFTGRIAGAAFAAGLDLGIVHDHSALCVTAKVQPYGQTPSYRLASLRTWAPVNRGRIDLEEVERACLGAKAKFGLTVIGFDPWQAEYLAERLRKQGMRPVPYSFASAKNLDDMARMLIEVFRNRQFSMYDCPRLVADLKRLSIVDRPGKGYRLQAVSDSSGHADSAVALVLSLLANRDHGQAAVHQWGGVIGDHEVAGLSYGSGRREGSQEQSSYFARGPRQGGFLT